MSVHSIDTGFVEVAAENLSGLPNRLVASTVRELAGQLSQWTQEQRAQKGKPTLFSRTKYVSSENPYDMMKTAKRAVVDDDVVSATADVTEGLIFQGSAWESSDEIASAIMNKVAEDLDLDNYFRMAHRELFTYSQVVTALWWGRKEIQPNVRRPSGKKNKDGSPRTYPSRSSFTLNVPTKIVLLDPTKVVPVGNRVFGEDRLAWHATDATIEAWEKGEANPYAARDETIAQLFIGRYQPSKDEEAWMGSLGIDPRKLMEFNPQAVWRHSLTRSSYEGFPDLRMKSAFRHLDLKAQLMDSDRVMLVGAANYLLLVKKGSDDHPGLPEEIDNLRDNFQVLAKLPVIVSDHRLSIEIVAPKLDTTLDPKKYDLLDSRIAARLLGIPQVDTGARGDQTAGTTSRMIARRLESERHMLRRATEKHLAKAIWERNEQALSKYTNVPSLAFMPRNVQLDSDTVILSAIIQARNSRDLSRESYLEFFGFDQAVEAQRMEREAEIYDDIFQTAVPFSAAGGDGSGGGATPQGGRPQGGGSPKQSAQGAVKQRTSTGAPSTGGAGK